MADLTRVDKIKAAERRAFVLDQRKGGLTYRQINAQVHKKFPDDQLPKGYDERGCWMDVTAELKRIHTENNEAAQEVRTLELDRLDTMQAALWGKVIAGNEGAVDRVLRIMQRRADLLGIDAAKAVTVAGPGGEALAPQVIQIYIPSNSRGDDKPAA